MADRRKRLSLIPFVAAITFAAVLILVELITPLDRLHTANENEYQNLAVGGKVCVDGDIVYYVSSTGSVRAKGETSDFKISDGGKKLQPFDNGVIFLSEGNVIFSDLSGTQKKTLLDGVDDYFLSGNWLFYTETGKKDLKKIRLTDLKRFDLGIEVNGQFAVRGNTVIYVGEKGYLYSARTDGSDQKPFLGKKVDLFMFYGNFVYFLRDGEVWSAANQNTASMLTYCEADTFTVFDDTLYYIDDGAVYSRDLTDEEAKPKTIKTKGENPTELYVSEGCLYYYLADGSLYRSDLYGAGAVKL